MTRKKETELELIFLCSGIVNFLKSILTKLQKIRNMIMFSDSVAEKVKSKIFFISCQSGFHFHVMSGCQKSFDIHIYFRKKQVFQYCMEFEK